MISRRSFLKALPAAALTLTACGREKTEPAHTESLVFSHSYPLDYAKQFTADCYEGGYTMLTIEDQQFLVMPEGAAEVENLPEDVTALRQPVQNIYLVSSAVMDHFVHLDGLGSIALSGTQTDNWQLDAAKVAMQAGKIAYAGKYSAPDYEKILATGCQLTIENTMIYHTPEVKEQLERFGIPVLVERSSYEADPLARMEWIKLWGILLGKKDTAERVFAQAVEQIAPLLEEHPTGKTAAFFSITSNHLATVRKGNDYVARMIEMAGADYVFDSLTDSGNNLATINLPLEDFYAGAKDAEFLIYNSTIEGMVDSTEQLLAKCPLLADFKAVQSGNVYCTTPGFFPQSMELVEMIVQMTRIFTQDTPQDLTFFVHVT